MSVTAVCVCRLLRARTSLGSLNTKRKGFLWYFAVLYWGARGAHTRTGYKFGASVYIALVCPFARENELDKRRDPTFFYSRNGVPGTACRRNSSHVRNIVVLVCVIPLSLLRALLCFFLFFCNSPLLYITQHCSEPLHLACCLSCSPSLFNFLAFSRSHIDLASCVFSFACFHASVVNYVMFCFFFRVPSAGQYKANRNYSTPLSFMNETLLFQFWWCSGHRTCPTASSPGRTFLEV